MSMPERSAQTLGALVVVSLSALGLSLGSASADPTPVIPNPLKTSQTVPPPYVAPTTGIIDTVVPGSPSVSYQVVSDFGDTTTADVKYTEDGKIVGFTSVALPWTKPVAVTPPLSIVTVYATLPKPADPDEPTREDAGVTCRVLVNGAVVKQDTAHGTNATATCSVSLNIDTSLVPPPAPGASAPGAPVPTHAAPPVR